MSLRAEVAVPVAIAFLFGSALGLVVGWVAGSGGQTELAPAAAMRGGQREAEPPGGRADPARQEMQLREALAMHEELLGKDPANPRLLRTVGEYRAALGDHVSALREYGRAEEALKGSPSEEGELPQLLFDQALSLAELDRYAESLALLQRAAELEPANVAPRLIQVYIYMRRIMPAPPPGFDRREALQAAEVLIEEILLLEPGNADALQLKEAIASVRRGRQGAASGASDGAVDGAAGAAADPAP